MNTVEFEMRLKCNCSPAHISILLQQTLSKHQIECEIRFTNIVRAQEPGSPKWKTPEGWYVSDWNEFYPTTDPPKNKYDIAVGELIFHTEENYTIFLMKCPVENDRFVLDLT